eukprot:scaffold1284_cov108-Cylindrotheca_fusiformis.AAC.26
MTVSEEKTKKKKKRSSVDRKSDERGTKKKNKDGPDKGLKRAESKKKLKKNKSDGSLNKKTKKKKAKKDIASSSDAEDDDDEFLPDSPLRDRSSRPSLKKANSLSDLNRSTSLGGGSGHDASSTHSSRSRGGPARNKGGRGSNPPGRGVLRSASVSIMDRPGPRPGALSRSNSHRDVSSRPSLTRGHSLSVLNRSTGLESSSAHSTRRSSRSRGGPSRNMGGRGSHPGRGILRSTSVSVMDRPSPRPGALSRANSFGGGLSRPSLGPRQPSFMRKSRQHANNDLGPRPTGQVAERLNMDGQVSSTHSSGSGSGRPSLARSKSSQSSKRLMAMDGAIVPVNSGGSSHGDRPRLGRSKSRISSARMEMDGTIASTRSGGSGRPSLADTKSSQSFASMSLSMRSLDVGFIDDPKWKQVLRFCKILPPTPDEQPIQRKQRIFIWLSMILDFIAALVSMTTYDGVTTCCGVPIFDIASAVINWDKFIQVTTYIYMAMIFIEVFPVFEKGLPINLINPFLGFTITFAMFFDDRILEAVTMWAIEAVAIFCEVYVYRLKSLDYKEGEERVNACTEELDSRKSKRRLSDDSFDGFAGDEGDLESAHDDLKRLDKFRIERERRRLRVSQKTEAISLRYHFIGTVVNCGLVVLSLSLIIGVGKNGGLCIYHLEAPSIFSDGQLELCSACKDMADDVCEVCDPEGTEHQCYYPYL